MEAKERIQMLILEMQAIEEWGRLAEADGLRLEADTREAQRRRRAEIMIELEAILGDRCGDCPVLETSGQAVVSRMTINSSKVSSN